MDILSTREATIEMSLVNVSSALSEITAALALCWSFRTIRTGVQRTDNVLQRLFVYSITRGILLTAHQILSLVLFAIQPTPGTLWVPFEMTLSKMYFATMLSLLNTRPALRNRLGLTVEITRTVDADSNVNVNVNGTNQGNRISLRSMAFRDPLGTNNLTTMGTSSTSDTESEYPPEFDLGEHPSHSLQKDGSEPKQTV
ncbi:hypothetical protein D9758_013195 [Tetrapyrgos nigripes]|uniref:DUF6534 domain-containing protein n=1 Tax=Tetrapyrgos nigripes TaxID=182062 RepID=A0A8H5FS15_9AGAR|nr:hypothetical protein D9758_013195 [Tetrapyrgos nigripes]